LVSEKDEVTDCVAHRSPSEHFRDIFLNYITVSFCGRLAVTELTTVVYLFICAFAVFIQTALRDHVVARNYVYASIQFFSTF